VGDAGLAHLGGCRGLTLLVLYNARVTAAKVEGLKKSLPKCRIEYDGGVTEPN
jgi:hypothetical protein